MLKEKQLKTKIIKKLEDIPAERLKEVYRILNSVQFSEKKPQKKKNMLTFAGIWKDMPEDVFESFTKRLHVRRKRAFGKRRIS